MSCPWLNLPNDAMSIHWLDQESNIFLLPDVVLTCLYRCCAGVNHHHYSIAAWRDNPQGGEHIAVRKH